MTTDELKRILTDRISTINDKSILETINAILDTNSESILYKTTPQPLTTSRKGKTQMRKGAYFLNDQVVKKIDQWLSKE